MRKQIITLWVYFVAIAVLITIALHVEAGAANASVKPGPDIMHTHLIPKKKDVLANLHSLQIPVLDKKGKYSDEQARSFCAARLLSSNKASREAPSREEKVLFHKLENLTVPKWGRDGLNVSVTCQVGFWVENGEITRIMPVSTGRKGYETRVGRYVVKRQWDGWHNSTLYGVPLYKTSYFSGGQAVHGLTSDSLVKPYPASAGCVRMTKKDAKWVYDRVKNRNITIHGKWQG